LPMAFTLDTLHDLAYVLTTYFPTPAWRYLPAGFKTAV
jgi:hypothetical protein